MKACYRYYFIEPIKSHYEDYGHNDIFTIEINGEKHNYSATIIGENEVPQMLRIGVSALDDDNLPEECLKPIQQINKHMLAILKLTYDPEINFFKTQAWNYVEEDKGPSFSIRIEQRFQDVPILPERVKMLFFSTWENRYFINLLTESLDETIPIYYRYLSMYRIIEMVYKENRKWNEELHDLLDKYQEEYNKLEISDISFLGYIELLRNKCAHGKFMMKKTNEKGVTALDNSGLIQLEKFIPLMKEIVITTINEQEQSLGRFMLSSKPIDKIT